MTCEFILSGISNEEVKHENGYDIFEPTLVLKIEGKNVFRFLGLDGVKNTVIMSEGTYRYWLTGTGFGFRLNRIGNFLRVFVEVDGHYGPVQGIRYPQSEYVGDALVEEWVRAFLLLSRSLSKIFERLNPTIYELPGIQKQEKKLSEIAGWLDTQSGSRTA
jgi:hypothetical protein